MDRLFLINWHTFVIIKHVRSKQMKSMKCEDCGGRLEYDKVTGKAKCPYCGAVHTETGATEKKIDDDVKAINDFVDKVESNINENNSSGMNIFVFIMLLFLCWPIAIIYLIMSSRKKK